MIHTLYRSAKKRENCSSKYIGVCWNKQAKKWYAQCYINKKTKFLGAYDNELDARDRFRDFVYEQGIAHLYKDDVETY